MGEVHSDSNAHTLLARWEFDFHLSRLVTSITKHTPTIRTEALSDRCQLNWSKYTFPHCAVFCECSLFWYRNSVCLTVALSTPDMFVWTLLSLMGVSYEVQKPHKKRNSEPPWPNGEPSADIQCWGKKYELFTTYPVPHGSRSHGHDRRSPKHKHLPRLTEVY